jgi:hypothetical protein
VDEGGRGTGDEDVPVTCAPQWKVENCVGQPEKLEDTLNALTRAGWEIKTVTEVAIEDQTYYTVIAYRDMPRTGEGIKV